MIRLNSLEVRHVRGIAGTGPDLMLGGKSLILLGDNATGKSSYIDALEFLLTKQCTSLDINREGVKWEEGGCHIRATPKDLFIKGEIQDDTGAIHTLDHQTDHAQLQDPLRAWIRAAQQRAFLLRRRTLLRLIETRPKERYEALTPFFALDRFATFEKSLKAIAEDLERRAKAAFQSTAAYEDQIRRVLGIAADVRIEDQAVLRVASERLHAVGKGALKSLQEVKAVQDAVDQEMRTFSGTEQAVKLETVAQALQGVPTITPLRQAIDALAARAERLERLEQSLSKGFAIEVLQKGRNWILEGDLGTCPLCEQPLNDKQGILARIADRVKECAEVVSAKEAIDKERKLCFEQVVEIGKAWSTANTAWNQKLGAEPAEIGALVEQLRLIAKSLGQPSSGTEILKGLPKLLQDVDPDALRATLMTSLQEQLKGIGGIGRYKALSAANQALAAASINWPQLADARKMHQNTLKLKGTIDRLVAHCIQARKDTVQKIVVGIGEETNRLYSALHPQEKIGSVALKVPPRGDGSISMDSQFFDKRGDARLYFSESHLDTLGVALFLALRKKQAAADPHFKLLVLDDVFHSVDSRHRLRAARMILKEFGDHQFIITTHDSVWFSLLQEAVNDFGLRDKVMLRRISDWTLETGPIWGDHEAEYAFLTSDRIKTAQPPDIAVKAGRLLEEILKPLCEQLNLAVPFRYSRRYDLGALWPAFRSAGNKHPGFAAKNKDLLETLELTDWIRNEIGAHSNPSPAPPTMDEAKRFAEAVVALYQATRHADCGRFIQEVDAPKGDWLCRCGKLSYPKKVDAKPPG